MPAWCGGRRIDGRQSDQATTEIALLKEEHLVKYTY
jgi:hypothetical protein